MPRSARRILVNLTDEMSDLKQALTSIQGDLANVRQAQLEGNRTMAISAESGEYDPRNTKESGEDTGARSTCSFDSKIEI